MDCRGPSAFRLAVLVHDAACARGPASSLRHFALAQVEATNKGYQRNRKNNREENSPSADHEEASAFSFHAFFFTVTSNEKAEHTDLSKQS